MASGFPLCVNGIQLHTSEALYQACRFPHLPDVQSEIIAQKSPMTAKMKSKPYRQDSRPDWDKVRVKIMRWCLRVKLAQNWGTFSKLLLETENCPIVEQSWKDAFWGARAVDDNTLVGMNVLGRLLMELREIVKSEERESLLCVQPIKFPDFRLAGYPIEAVPGEGIESLAIVAAKPDKPVSIQESHTTRAQGLFFEKPLVRESPPSCTAGSVFKELKPYPAMKDSGVEWLGEVPVHWEVRRLRNAADMRVSNVDKHVKKAETPVRLCNYVDVYKNDCISQQMNFMQATATAKEIERFLLEKGDVLITKDSETWDDIGVPALVTESAPDFISGYHLALLRPCVDQLMGSFLLRSLQSKGLAYQFYVEAKGVTRYGLSHSGIKSVWMPLPPLPEQAAIVRFLDFIDQPVQRLLRAKRKLIALLTEQKQAIIHRAVTRGLDPDVPLKDSGVEWLGKVPAHWSVTRVKTEFRCLNSRRVPLSGPERGAMTSRKYDYYGASGIIDKVEDYLFEDKLLLIAEDGANLVLRNLPLAIIAQGKFWVNNHAHILKPRRGNIEYLAAVMESLSYKSWISGAAQPKLTKDRIMAITIAVPSPLEQDKIIESAHSETSPLRTTIQRAKREIELLNEYRTRLIADVVTGKLDVRTAAAGLPETAPLNTENEPSNRHDLDIETSPDELDTIPAEAKA